MSYDTHKFNYFKDFIFFFFLLSDILENLSTSLIEDFINSVRNIWCLTTIFTPHHSILNMPEYALTEFWIYPRFYICQDAEYGRALNMQELHRVLNMWQSDNKEGSESVSYNA